LTTRPHRQTKSHGGGGWSSPSEAPEPTNHGPGGSPPRSAETRGPERGRATRRRPRHHQPAPLGDDTRGSHPRRRRSGTPMAPLFASQVSSTASVRGRAGYKAPSASLAATASASGILERDMSRVRPGGTSGRRRSTATVLGACGSRPWWLGPASPMPTVRRRARRQTPVAMVAAG
jgi:hypothetical protein